jgi:hypothetical protein
LGVVRRELSAQWRTDIFAANVASSKAFVITPDFRVAFVTLAIGTALEFQLVSREAVPPGRLFSGCASRLFSYDAQHSILYSVDCERRVRSKRVFLFESLLFVSKSSIVYCDADWRIHKATLDLERDEVLTHCKDHICCIAASTEFHLVVLGTVHCSVRFRSLNDGREVRSVGLDNELPLDVVITKSCGFVVVRTPKSVIVLTTNGSFVSRAKLPSEVVAWRTFASWNGFDYLAIAGRDRRLVVCQVMYPGKTVVVGNFNRLLAFDYCNQCESFVLVKRPRKVKVVPFSLKTVSQPPEVTLARIQNGAESGR